MLINRELAVLILYSVIGITFGIGSLQYDIGTLDNMQTGYFPALISGILILIGILNYIKNFKQKDKVVIHINIPILLIAIIVLTFVIAKLSGLLLASIFLVWSSSYLHPEFNLKHTSIITAVSILLLLILKFTVLRALPLW